MRHGWLDEPEEAHVSWASFRAIAPSRGLLDTILWELSDACPTRLYYQNGRFVRAGFMEGSRLVDFAPPLGRQRVYYVPHPEVTTLPRTFPTLRFCAVRGTWRPKLMEDVRVLNEYGLLDPEALEHTKERIWARFGGSGDEEPWRLFVNVEVVGKRGGEPWRRVYDASHPDWGQEGTGRMTGICAAVGAQLLGRHGRTRAGFVDPEAYFDPDEFLAELGKRGTDRGELARRAVVGRTRPERRKERGAALHRRGVRRLGVGPADRGREPGDGGGRSPRCPNASADDVDRAVGGSTEARSARGGGSTRSRALTRCTSARGVSRSTPTSSPCC